MSLPPPQSKPLPSSYRDPSGFVFTYKDEIYRQVNKSFQKDYETFNDSGLYNDLLSKEVILRHDEIKENLTGTGDWLITLRTDKVFTELPVSNPWLAFFIFLKRKRIDKGHAATMQLNIVRRRIF